MTDLKQVMTRLYGRDPSDHELRRVHSIAAAMGISENDEFILLLACLEAYHSLFEDIPQKTVNKVKRATEAAETQATTLINQWMRSQQTDFKHFSDKTKEIVEDIRLAASHAEKQASATIKKIAAEQQETLTKAVATSAEKVAATASAKTLAKWIGSGVVICCLCLIGTGIVGYKLGKDSGMAQGIAQTTDQELLLKKRDAWTNSKSFKQAYALYEMGNLEQILNCNFAEGWYIKNNVCYPAPTTNKEGRRVNIGWTMPQLKEE